MKDNPCMLYSYNVPTVYKVIDNFVQLLCECGDRVKVDQSSFSAYLHAVMLHIHCSEYHGEPCRQRFGCLVATTLCGGFL